MPGLRSFALTASAVLSAVQAAPYAPRPLGPSPGAAAGANADLFYSPNNPSSIPIITQSAQPVDTTCTDSTAAPTAPTNPSFYLPENPSSIPRFTETAPASLLSLLTQSTAGPVDTICTDSTAPAVTSYAASASAFPSISINASDIPAYQKAPYGFAQSGFAPRATGSYHKHRNGGGYGHGKFHHPSGTAPYPINPTGQPTAYSTGQSASYPTATSASSKPQPTTLYGVNLGGWLILEKWMNSDVFEGTQATDQYSFDQTEGAEQALQKHWSSYITEDDFKQISEWGINAVRIPIGYWAYNNYGTSYIKGADVYLEKAIEWARQYNIKVLVDCHGSPGSQNGFDNSGRSGYVKWQEDDNMSQSIDVLKTMAQKYGSNKYADVVSSIELVNEPISWDQNNFTKTQEWAKEAYSAVRDAAENKDLKIVMHDGFETPAKWQQVGQSINGNLTKANAGFVVDVHLYQNQMDADKKLDQSQHIQKACNNWTASELLPKSSQLPVYVGEFTPATDICAYENSDKTTGGDSCTEDQCQCSCNQDITIWRAPLKAATGKFFEAQIDAFEQTAAGWFVWSWKGPGAWGLQNLIQQGIVADHVTERKYAPQCSFSAGNATAY